MSAALEKKFNAQITLEFESSMVYRQLAIEMEDQHLPGIANWLRQQADEEIMHGNKFIDHLSARDNHPVIGAISAPKVSAKSVLDVFESALAHERRVSESIRDLYTATEKAGDLDSRPLLLWFLSEQVEEEDTVDELVGRLKLINEDGPGLLRLDEDLARRPAPATTPAGA